MNRLPILKMAIILLVCIFATTQIYAQSKGKTITKTTETKTETKANSSDWKKGGTGRLSFSHYNYTQWAAGLGNASNIEANLGLFADMVKGKTSWNNAGEFKLGFVNTENYNKFVKAADLLKLASTFNYKITPKLDWTTPLIFESQFAKTIMFSKFPDAQGSPVDSVVVAKFAAPATITLSTGVTWRPIEAAKRNALDFNLFFSPVTFKGILVNDDAIGLLKSASDPNVNIYGNLISGNEFQKLRPEAGALARAGFTYKGVKNLVITSNLEAFYNILSNKFKDIKRKQSFEDIDVKWGNKVDLNVPVTLAGKTFNFNATYEMGLVHDNDIEVYSYNSDKHAREIKDTNIQFMNFIGMGLTYQFGYKK